MKEEKEMIDFTQFNAFAAQVFQTFNTAFANGMGQDILTEIGQVTAAVAAKGADPAADLAAIQTLNKIVNDLVTAKKQVAAGTGTVTPAAS